MSPCSYFSLSSKRSQVICARNDKNAFFGHPTVVWRQIATQPPRVSSRTLYRLQVDSVGYIFAADSVRLSSFTFSWRAPKDARSTLRSAYCWIFPERIDISWIGKADDAGSCHFAIVSCLFITETPRISTWILQLERKVCGLLFFAANSMVYFYRYML